MSEPTVPGEPAPEPGDRVTEPIAPQAPPAPPVWPYPPAAQPTPAAAPPPLPPPAAYPPAAGPGQPYPPAPYPAQPYPPTAYPAQSYAAGYAVQTTSGTAVTALVLGIVSWVLCPVVPAIIALVLAASARREIQASGGRIGGDGLVTAAKVISWINIGVFLAVTVVFGLIVLLGLVAGGTSSMWGSGSF